MCMHHQEDLGEPERYLYLLGNSMVPSSEYWIPIHLPPFFGEIIDPICSYRGYLPSMYLADNFSESKNLELQASLARPESHNQELAVK